MIEVIRNSEPTARKEYSCDACTFLFELDDPCELGLTYREKREVVKAKQKNYKILKGEKYIRQFNKMDGHTYDFKAIPSIHKICLKYNLYEP
jgi:hypothetical protein